MAQRRGGERGVAKLVTCMVLLLFGALGLTAGCSAETGAEALDGSSQEQTLCMCPKNTPCVTYTCFKTQCVETIAKDGEACEDKAGGFKGVCLEALCCPGCVVKNKLGASTCARGEGTEPAQCGQSGEYCSNCKSNTCLAGTCNTRKQCDPVPEGEACVGATGACHNGSCCSGCIDGNDNCVAGGAIDACGASDGKLVKCKNCDDGDDCDGKDSCSAGSCVASAPLDCDDNEKCTADSCTASSCDHQPLTGQPCNDGDPCTTDDKCGADGKCAPGTPINCDDGEFCTDDKCEGGTCVHPPKADTVTCTDGNMCTTADHCTSGKCKGTSAGGVDCNDNKVCTVDTQPDCTTNVCNHTPAPATVSCIVDKCHEAGHCSGTDESCVPGPEIDCDDKNPCTKDECDAATGCTHTNDASADCSDGDPCTENDVCVKGACGGKPKKCAALDACHEPGTCDQTTGTCNDPRAEDDKPCPGGACMNGTCILDPTLGMGGEGAGGEAAGGAGPGPGAGGETSAAGGAGPTTPVGEAGQGEQPSGQAGDGTVEEPERAFVRQPGGCSCELPGRSGGEQRPISIIGLAFLAGAALRRRSRERAAA